MSRVLLKLQRLVNFVLLRFREKNMLGLNY